MISGLTALLLSLLSRKPTVPLLLTKSIGTVGLLQSNDSKAIKPLMPFHSNKGTVGLLKSNDNNKAIKPPKVTYTYLFASKLNSQCPPYFDINTWQHLGPLVYL